MSTKLGVALVILLAVALVVGTGYLLVRPAQAEDLAALGRRGDGIELQQGGAWTEKRGGAGYGDRAADNCVDGCTGSGTTGQHGMQGGGFNQERTEQGLRSNGQQAQGMRGPFNPVGTTDHAGEWQTLEGKVTVVDTDVTMQTSEGAVLVGLGQSWYREQAGFTLKVGDEVVVTGFYEDGEFKAGTIENRTTGETLELRDETGRPMWAGQGMQRYQ